MDVKDLIAALGVLVDPNASDEDKAAALDKLTAYFNAQLDAQESPAGTAEQTSETPFEATKTEATSEAGDGADDKAKDDDKAKEMTSALTSALAEIKSLKERVAKMEKASAIGAAPRAKTPTVLPRKEPPAPKDHVVSMIEAAERNTLRNLSK